MKPFSMVFTLMVDQTVMAEYFSRKIKMVSNILVNGKMAYLVEVKVLILMLVETRLKDSGLKDE
jgi:hypothetical protein